MTAMFAMPSSPAPAEAPVQPGNAGITGKPEATAKGNPPAQGQRPEWLDPKFESPEALAKAYAELQKKLGGGQEQPPAQTQAAPAVDLGETHESVGQALKTAELDVTEFYTEFDNAGELSAASYEKLAKAGISKEQVDATIGKLQAANEAKVSGIFQQAGVTSEVFSRVQQWAAVTLPKDELAGFNAMMETGSDAAVAFAIRQLNARYTQAFGQAPKLLEGDSAPSLVGYRDVEEMKRDMRDKRYGKDKAFTRDVERKVANAKW